MRWGKEMQMRWKVKTYPSSETETQQQPQQKDERRKNMSFHMHGPRYVGGGKRKLRIEEKYTLISPEGQKIGPFETVDRELEPWLQEIIDVCIEKGYEMECKLIAV